MSIVNQHNARKQAYIENNPESITWEITSACNKRCSFCYHSPDQIRVPYHISVQEVNNVLALIQQLKIKHVALTGGEPILHPCFKGILKSLRSIVDNVTVFTNGIACNTTVCEYITERDCSINYSFDLDDPLSESYLRKLRSAVSDNRITVSVVYNGQDVGQTIKQIAGIRNYFSGDVQVNIAQFKGHAAYSSEAVEKMLEIAKILVGYRMQGVLSVTGQHISVPINNYFSPSRAISFGCSIGNSLKVDIDGNIFPCPFFTSAVFSIGNAYKHSYPPIDMGKILMLKELLFSRVEHVTKCIECKWRFFCGGGCLVCLETSCYENHSTVNPICCRINKTVYEYINSVWEMY